MQAQLMRSRFSWVFFFVSALIKRKMSYPVIWNNWYGRKQERTLQLLSNAYQRKLGNDVRASHPYAEVTRVEWDKAGAFTLHLTNGTAEHYHSTRQVAEIAAVFQRHCKVVAL